MEYRLSFEKPENYPAPKHGLDEWEENIVEFRAKSIARAKKRARSILAQPDMSAKVGNRTYYPRKIQLIQVRRIELPGLKFPIEA